MEKRAIGPGLLKAVLLLGLAAAGCRRGATPPGDVVARVNGEPIAAAELDRLVAQQTATGGGPAAAPHLTPEQGLRLRLALLDQLIDRHLLLQYAAHAGITADPRDVARELDAARLREPNAADADLRREVTDNLVLQRLLEREVTSRVQVTEQQVDAFYHDNQPSFNLPERQYHVLEIVVTPQPGPVTNLSEDKAVSPAEARKKIKMLQQRLAAKADFSALAQQYSEDGATASSGGDMGLIPQSVLTAQIAPPLRDAILALHPGQVSPVIQTSTGFYLLKLVDVEAPGARPLTDPQVRESIQELLGNAREQVLQTAFMSVVRDQAKVENYLADRVLSAGGTAP